VIDSKDVRRNLDEWLQNPSWKGIYDNAPSEACRKYLAMLFYASETEEEEAFDAMDQMEQNLSLDDLRYMLQNSIGPAKARYMSLIEKIEK